ncbi:unnamed protein product [Parascedosporium putredinis]|uniref:HhH-GPD domain-containing protein n=1 Tax=Parascedosporium putredinis TaxID=1442378 RepID=A0A9P1H202_9PEZI|nr:unnamed protein product [Parascedosporium putredinis]CAI7994146.1 unnamed protein product [Parascedosporium putredinis]
MKRKVSPPDGDPQITTQRRSKRLAENDKVRGTVTPTIADQDQTPAGISYLSFGEKLGGLRKKQPASDTHTALRVASFKNYAAYMGTPIFREGLGELKDLANSSPRSSPQGTAIMCSETLWWRCHRRMISDILTTAGWTVQHLGIKEVPVKHVRWDIARLERDGSLVYDGGSGKLV